MNQPEENQENPQTECIQSGDCIPEVRCRHCGKRFSFMDVESMFRELTNLQWHAQQCQRESEEVKEMLKREQESNAKLIQEKKEMAIERENNERVWNKANEKNKNKIRFLVAILILLFGIMIGQLFK